MPTTLPFQRRKKGTGGPSGQRSQIKIDLKKTTASEEPQQGPLPSGKTADTASKPVSSMDGLAGGGIGFSPRNSPETRQLADLPPPQYYDPAPAAINRFSIGNASRGNINLGGLWSGADRNPTYDPLAGASSTNTPYQGTSGFVGGLKRLFLGNHANELNAGAIDQANAIRFADQARREKVADAIAQAGGIAQATGEFGKTGAQTTAITDANSRDNAIQPLVVDDMRARTASTVGNENRAGQRFQYELPTMEEQLRGEQARNDEFENNAPLRRDALAGENLYRNTQTSNAVADDYRKAQSFPLDQAGKRLTIRGEQQKLTQPVSLGGGMVLTPGINEISRYNEFGNMPGTVPGSMQTLRKGVINPSTFADDNIGPDGIPVSQLGPTPALQPLAGAGTRSTFEPPMPRPVTPPTTDNSMLPVIGERLRDSLINYANNKGFNMRPGTQFNDPLGRGISNDDNGAMSFSGNTEVTPDMQKQIEMAPDPQKHQLLQRLTRQLYRR